MTTNGKPYVLIVEDNPADVRVIERVFDGMERSFTLRVLTTGTEAVEFLFSGFGEHENPPALVLLDLNLPGTDGRTILRDMKEDESLGEIPVVVLTTSDTRDDRKLCYEAGANSYIVKPSEPEVYRRQLQLIEDYWFGVVSLPREIS